MLRPPRPQSSSRQAAPLRQVHAVVGRARGSAARSSAALPHREHRPRTRGGGQRRPRAAAEEEAASDESHRCCDGDGHHDGEGGSGDGQEEERQEK